MSNEEQDRLVVVGILETRPALCRRKLVEATRLTDLRLDVALSSLCRDGRVLRMGRAYYLAGRAAR